MAIQHWSDNIIVVDLPREPEMSEELNGVAGILCERDVRSVIIDFSDVDIVTSSSLSKLLELRNLMADWGRRLVFCGVAVAIKGVFAVAGLEKEFELVDDRFSALTTIEMVG